jgi:hypothetical protein
MNKYKISQSLATLAIAVTLFTGCESKQNAAVDQAKKTAATTGQPQQVISTDKNGNTTTTVVQPPVPGQTSQATSTTVTPASATAPNSPAVVGGPAPGQPAIAGQPPTQTVPGGNPIIRPADVNVPAGTPLVIRINQHISAKHNRPGDRFDGEIVESVSDQNNRIIIPKGTPVGGIVDASHRRGHFKGSSIIELRLTSLTLNGTNYPLETRDYARTKKGKGKRSAAIIGGGAGLGMLIGGIATGGTGLLIGGLAGGGAGTGVAAFTGNRDIEIPSESVVHFKLSDDLTLMQ